MQKQSNVSTVILLSILFIFSSFSAYSQELSASSTATTGFMSSFGIGHTNLTSQDDLDAGGSAFLGLGYGYNEHMSAWLNLMASGLSNTGDVNTDPGLAGAELSLKYGFLPHSNVQPYTRFGIGAYAIGDEKTDVAISGFGMTLALGADYFFSRHFAIGGEMQLRNISYSKESIDNDGNFSDLDRDIVGDMVSYMLTFTYRR